MNEREKDIQALATAVLEMSTISWDNPNGPYECTCPICYERVYGTLTADMSEIKHSPNCAYLIAKDLTTNN